MSLAYRTGTIAVPNAGTTVTGTLTAWTNQVKQGDLIHLPDGKFYEVADDPASNTSLTIVEPYAGTTVASAGAYRIYRYSDGWRPTAEINIRLGNLLDRFENVTGFILNGTGVPSDSLGEDGDLYIRTDDPSIYSKEAGAWDSGVSLGGPTGATGASYAGSSTTSRGIGTGSMTVTASTGMAFVPGSRVRLASAASPTTHWMEGAVTAYNSGTGSLTFTSDAFLGSGSRADWNISLAGERGATGATGPSFAATSTTSLLIGTGTKAFTGVSTSLAYSVGQRARAASAADTANWMEGRITGYSGGTLTLSVDAIGGSGTLADWNINVAGSQGIQGATGATGATGSTGPAGPSYAATSTTSLAIGTGAKASTTQAGLAYVVGSRVRMSSAANTSNYMEGVCTAYNSGTGAITIDVEIVGGSGTYADWNFSLAGNRGIAGVSLVYVSGGYNGATTYNQGEWLKEGTAAWVYINATPAAGNALPVLPTTSDTYWQLLAEDGLDGSGSVDSVNGQNGAVVLTASDIEIDSLTPTGYTPAGASIEQHLSGISTALLSAGINDNFLVNGDGLFNTNLATSAADTVGIVDHWRAITQTGAIAFSVQSDVADGVPKMIRLSQSQASAQRMGAAQTIEAAASKLLRGSDVSLSGKVRLSTSATVRFALLAWTGTADAAPADPVNDFTSDTYTTGNFFTSTTMTLIAEGNLAVTANTLTDISLSGSVPSGTNNIILMVWTSATAIQNVTLDYRAKLEKGGTGTGWTPSDPGLEYARTDVFARIMETANAVACRAANLAVNGNFSFDQQNARASSTADDYYFGDNWSAKRSITSGTVAAQSYGSPGIGGYKNYGGLTATTGVTLSSNNFVFIQHPIEGERMAQLRFGGASAKGIKVGFWCYATKTGLATVALRNASAARTQLATFTVNATNTWEWKVVTFTGDTSGTWASDVTRGADLNFCAGSATGSSFLSSTVGSWLSGNYVAATGQVNFMASNSDVFFITGLTIIPADMEMPSSAYAYLAQKDDTVTREEVQRYIELLPVTRFTGVVFTSTQILVNASFLTKKRATGASVTLLNTAGNLFHNGQAQLGGTHSLAASVVSESSIYCQLDNLTGATAGNGVIGFAANTNLLLVNSRY